MDKCPNVAKKFDEVPNWLRQRLNIQTSKGKTDNSKGRIPQEVFEMVDSILKQAVEEGFELSNGSVQAVVEDACNAFNEEVRGENFVVLPLCCLVE